MTLLFNASFLLNYYALSQNLKSIIILISNHFLQEHALEGIAVVQSRIHVVMVKEIVTGIMIVQEPTTVELIIVGDSMEKDPLMEMMIAVSTFTPSFQSIEIGKKVFLTLDNVFHVYLMSGLQKHAKQNFMMAFLKSPLSVLRCTRTDQINLKILLGYNVNYLSI